MAATQGVYSRENTRKVAAEPGVNRVLRAAVEPPSRTVRVLTTLSLAVKPVMRAVEIRQSPNPNGEKMGAIQLPTMASRLSAESVTRLSRVSKVWRNHMITEARKITVKALVAKSLAFSPMS